MRTRLRGGGYLSAWMSIAALLFAGSIAFAQTTTKTVTISGTVLDDSGAPIAGATVLYNNTVSSVRDRALHTHIFGTFIASSTTAAKDGTFSLTGLPPSVYWLCGVGTQPTHLRSCDWESPTTKIDLTSTSSATNVQLQVPVGVMLTFSVTDARNQINDFSATPVVNGAPAAPGNFRIYLADGTWLSPAQPVSVSGTVHQYAIAVPKARALRLFLDTKLNVQDQALTAVVPGKPGDTITIGAQPVSYTLTVQ